MNKKEMSGLIAGFVFVFFVVYYFHLPAVPLHFIGLLFLDCLLSFACSFCLVPVAQYFSRRLHVLDIPDGKIKLHSVATPYFGGVAVYLGCLVPALILSILFHYSLSHESIFLSVGCTILVSVGLIDDIYILKPRQKFVGQCLALLFFLYGGFYLHTTVYSFIFLALSALWILTVINAINLIDVMDGLSSTTAIMCAFGFMGVAVYLGEFTIAYILALFIGSLAGFLIYNLPPASIYMGDAGSLFIGGLLGALPLKLNFSVRSQEGYLIPIIVCAIPLLELTTLIVIRAYKKIPFYNGSPDHFSIYLQHYGWSKEKILMYVCSMMITLIGSAWGLVAGILNIYYIVFLAIILLFIWFTILICGSFCIARK